MSLVPPAVDSSRAGARRRIPALAGWAVVGCYLLAAVAVTWRLWADPAARVQAGYDTRDVDLFAWFIRYEATATAHGHLPALTTVAMNAPHGISMMWNTSLLLPGVALSPLTLLAGPQTTLTVLLTLGFAGSAASLYLVLRRWGASAGAAALGGAVYGFSPALLDAGIGHYHMQFAVFPPLLIDALLRLVTGRGRPVRTGAWLGLVAAAQVFTGEELLTDTAVAAVVVVVVVAAGRPRAIPERAKGALGGLVVAAVVALAICGRALWVQFRGPLSQHGSPWPAGQFYAHPAVFVTPPSTLLFHTQASAASAAANYATNLTEYLGYLGWPLLVVLAAAVLAGIRDPKLRAVGLTWVVLEIFTLGGHSAALPWHYLQHLPVLGQVLPDRFAIPADGAAAAVLAFSLDRMRAAGRRRADRRAAGRGHADWRTAGRRRADWRTVGRRRADWRTVLATGAVVLAVLPLVPRPYRAAPVSPAPAGWTPAFSRLRLAPSAPVLIIPIPFQRNTGPLRWQAETGNPGSLVAGYFIGPNASGHAEEYGTGLPDVARTLDSIWAGEPARAPSLARIRAAVAAWRPAAIVADVKETSRLGQILIKVFGRPTFQTGTLLAWRR